MQDKSQQTPVSAHAQHVQSLAAALFDRTRPLHGLSDDSRHTLEAATRLVDQPIPHSKKKAHKTARALAETLPAQELTPEEKKVLAGMIAFYYRWVKKKELERFDLSPAQQRETLTLTALLHIAEGLDASRSGSTSIQHIEPARDGMWIVITGEQAVSDAQAAQRCCRLWAKIGYPAITILNPGEAAQQLLPFPSPDEKIALSPTESLAEAARQVMRYNFAQMIKHEPGTRLGEDSEALHDMRVATRRMRASFEVFKDTFEPGALKLYLKGLRATGRALGAVRDLDVLIEKARRYLKTLEGKERLVEDQPEDLSPLIHSWEMQRQEARARMLVFLDSSEYAIFKREFNTFLLTPGAGTHPIPAGQPSAYRVCELAPVLIFTRLASVLAFDAFIPDASIDCLHALRIEFKKLRYTMEYFREVLGPQVQGIIEELKQLQDHLGDLNDTRVAIDLLEPFIAKADELSIDEQHVEYVRHYIETLAAEQQRLIADFPRAWKHFKRRQFRQNLAKAVAAL